MALSGRARTRDDVLRVVHRGLDVPQLARAASRALGRAVPFDGTCLLTMDPATMLPTGEVVENGLAADATARLTEIEQREPDVNKFTALARRRSPAASLGAATLGELDRSLRQRELRGPGGFADELRVVCSDATGTWGALTLLRKAGRPLFTPAEVAVAASIAGLLAEGLRRSLLLREASTDSGDDVGLLLLAPDDSVELANRPADRWLDALTGTDAADAELPVAVLAVAARARQLGSDHPVEDTVPAPSGLARARVRAPDGRWVVVRGSLVGGADKVAVLLEPPRPAELAPMIADAYGLTPRERRVTELVARGFSTDDVAARLHLSAYTVQDHLRSVFDKTGSGSRGEVVARLFFDSHAPRLTGIPPRSEDGDEHDPTT